MAACIHARRKIIDHVGQNAIFRLLFKETNVLCCHLRACSEMDITTDFGSVILGSSPGRRTNE